MTVVLLGRFERGLGLYTLEVIYVTIFIPDQFWVQANAAK